MYESPTKGSFSTSLPDAYFSEMAGVLDNYTRGWIDDKPHEYTRYFYDVYTYGRMDQMVDCVLPWLQAAIPDFEDRQVLEIGAGTGSSTAGLIQSCRSIFGFDIDASAIKIAQARCDLVKKYSACRASYQLKAYDTDWIDRFYEKPLSFFDRRADVAFAYALFEHLLPLERIKLLKALWKYLPVGGYLVTIELPNRLALVDWHTTSLPFADILPSEIYALYAGTSEKVEWDDIKAATIGDVGKVSRDRQYRLGRGVSYHEFYLALGHDSFEVVANDKSPHAIFRGNLPGYDAEYHEMVARQLAALDPPIDPSFAAPCLDLIIKKTR
jgi:SAM-dependent methyltransferase